MVIKKNTFDKFCVYGFPKDSFDKFWLYKFWFNRFDKFWLYGFENTVLIIFDFMDFE